MRYVGPSGKDKVRVLNFDVTRPTPEDWRKLDDNFYRQWRHFGARAERAGAYLQPLTDREVVSAFLASRSGFDALQNDMPAAQRDAERALALNPRNITAMINAGFALQGLNKLPEAEESYRKALKIDPESLHALNNADFPERPR